MLITTLLCKRVLTWDEESYRVTYIVDFIRQMQTRESDL